MTYAYTKTETQNYKKGKYIGTQTQKYSQEDVNKCMYIKQQIYI